MLTSSWRSLPTDNHQVYERPLGLTELCFYWDSVYERIADILQHTEVEIEPSKFEEATNLSNLTKIWTKLKQQFPLLGARLDERGDGSVFFVVTADNLNKCRPSEVTVQNISSLQQALDIVEKIITGRKHDLSNNLLARLVVLRRMDQKNHIHMLLHVSHCITDVTANITISRTILNHLCGTVNTPAWDLNDRLALSTASEELGSQRKFNSARRWWRIAIASVISVRRTSRLMVN
jgi:hypothetical protein